MVFTRLEAEANRAREAARAEAQEAAAAAAAARAREIAVAQELETRAMERYGMCRACDSGAPYFFSPGAPHIENNDRKRKPGEQSHGPL